MTDLNDPQERYRLDFADRLKTLRLNRGMSQRVLCKIAKMPESTYANYEHARALPNAYAITRLAWALAVSSDVLLGLEDER